MMQVSPTTLFLVEGCGQLGVAMCWGDGFITDHEIIARTGISDPNPFFQTLLGKPYLDNVIISPHYYPPSVSGSKGQNTRCEMSSKSHGHSKVHAMPVTTVRLLSHQSFLKLLEGQGMQSGHK